MIPWYENDPRFDSGTVAGFERFRLVLRYVNRRTGYCLYAAFRKADNSLPPMVRVMNIGECSLYEAQRAAEDWLKGIF